MTASPEPSYRSNNYALLIATWFWFIFKNFIGWLLILSAWPIGIALPGPGGIPIFLVGFALVTFPGKRKLTARVLRGKEVDFSTPFWRLIAIVIAFSCIALLIWYISGRTNASINALLYPRHRLVTTWITLSIFLWIIISLLLPRMNWIIRGCAGLRRKVRPSLRNYGIRLLPPRRRRRRLAKTQPPAPQNADEASDEEEIIEIHPRHMQKMVWRFILRWSKPVLGIGITALILIMMIRPLYARWGELQDRVLEQGLYAIILPGIIFIVMFAMFLFVFRVIIWRTLLSRMGYRLQMPVAMRVWSSSELARYIPGAIWQVLGRVYLLRPYNVPAAVTSTSQLMELILFLFANVLMAVVCLVWHGTKVDPRAQAWLYIVLGAIPLLAGLLHPRIFYAIINRVLIRFKRGPITQRVSAGTLFRLLLWNLIGLVWQSLAVFVVLDAVIGVDLMNWPVVAGGYSLAWCAGFLAVWAPGGLAVREVVFVAVMTLVLPSAMTQSEETVYLQGLLTILSFFIRLWTVGGELLLAAVANTLDYRGVIGQVTPDSQPDV